jgi:hypothetical protein
MGALTTVSIVIGFLFIVTIFYQNEDLFPRLMRWASVASINHAEIKNYAYSHYIAYLENNKNC